MLIDWFTVFAQIVNFLILIVLLKRFLYGPIVKAMGNRERRIASRITEAEQKRQAAEQELEDYRDKNQEFLEQREAMYAEAQAEVESYRKERLDELRQEIAEIRARWIQATRLEKDSLLNEVRQRICEQVLTLTRQAFTDLANRNLEEQIIAVFLQRIRELDDSALFTVGDVRQESGPDITIRSANELSPDMRTKIQSALTGKFGPGYSLGFETSPEIICGIEFGVPGQKVAWSLAHFLETVEDRLFEVI